MSTERGAQTTEDREPEPYSLATAHGFIHIWGGEGERKNEQDDVNPPVDDDDADDADADDEDDGDEDDVDDDDEDDSDEDKSKSKSKKKSKEPSLEEQLDEERRKRIKAENDLKKKTTAEEKAKEDKDLKKAHESTKKKLEARDKFLTENLLSMEIGKQKKFDFVDVEDVVALIRTKYADDVTVDLDDDTPSVEGLDLALKRIAKDKPHFLKKSKKEDDDDDDDDEPRQPSGNRSGNGKSKSQDAEDRRLGEKYKVPGYGTQLTRPM